MVMRFLKRKTQHAVSREDLDPARIPQHIAIIMDGNGRWAQQRGMPRVFGHRAGAEVLREIVRAASNLGVQVLTVYAFSTENWKRPTEEVTYLMELIAEYIENTLADMHANGVRVRVIGDSTVLNECLRQKLEHAMAETEHNPGLILNLAINYGGRAEITQGIRKIAAEVLQGKLQPEEITEQTISAHLYTAGQPEPDLLIRPSGDWRISNFLLWQLAYTEFWFTDECWPAFTPQTLYTAIAAYQRRNRRYGGLHNS